VLTWNLSEKEYPPIEKLDLSLRKY